MAVIMFSAEHEETADRRLTERARRRRNREKRLARERAGGPRFTPQEWSALKETFGNTCISCGEVEGWERDDEAGQNPVGSGPLYSFYSLSPDHVVPLCQGGTNDIGNIQPLCAYCNGRKGGRFIDYRVIPALFRRPAVRE